MMWGTRAATAVMAVASVAGLGVQSASAATTVTKYATGTTNVRSGAGTAYARVGTISAGTKVTGALQTNGWIKIATPATYAGRYVSGAVLTSTAPVVPKPAPTSGLVTGWVRGDSLAGYQAVVRVNVRSAPSVGSRIVGRLDRGSKVSGELKDGWVHTAKGYVDAALLEFASSNIYVDNARMPAKELCAVPAQYNSPLTFSVTSPDTGHRYAYDRGTVRYLHCAALPNLVSLEKAYFAARGHYAPIDLAYRGWDEQRAWATDKRYNGSPAGRSNHGWGLAVDFMDNGTKHDGTNEYADNGAGFAWMTKNATTYGFAVDPIVVTHEGPWRSETFHWNFTG